MKDNLIYALYCPIRNKPVYVGMSSVGMKRPFEHIKEQSHSIKVNEWINNLKLDGLSPILVILEYSDDGTILNEKETFWVNKFISEGNVLLNQNKIKPVIFDVLEYSNDKIDNGIEDISVFIKVRRKQCKLTQKELSLKAGVGLRLIRDLEQNTKNNFNTASILKILRLFGKKLSVVSDK